MRLLLLLSLGARFLFLLPLRGRFFFCCRCGGAFFLCFSLSLREPGFTHSLASWVRATTKNNIKQLQQKTGSLHGDVSHDKPHKEVEKGAVAEHG